MFKLLIGLVLLVVTLPAQSTPVETAVPTATVIVSPAPTATVIVSPVPTPTPQPSCPAFQGETYEACVRRVAQEDADRQRRIDNEDFTRGAIVAALVIFALWYLTYLAFKLWRAYQHRDPEAAAAYRGHTTTTTTSSALAPVAASSSSSSAPRRAGTSFGNGGSAGNVGSSSNYSSVSTSSSYSNGSAGSSGVTNMGNMHTVELGTIPHS
jgi:hypothetical protein